MELRTPIFALAFIGLVAAVPVAWDSDVSKCSRQCSVPENFIYQTGKTYTYNYESTTKLHLNEENGPSVRVSAKADISVIEDCELALKLRDVEVSGPVDKFDIKSALEDESLMFSFDDGRIQSVCPSPTDQRWAVNVKKGILSALQVNLRSMSGKSVLREKDVLGECETTYEVVSADPRSTTIRKTKDMKTCGKRHKAIAAIFPRGYLSPDNAVQSLPVMSNDFSCDITVSKNIVQSSLCTDKNEFLPLSWSQAGSHIETTIALNFERAATGLSARRPATISRQCLLFARNPEATEGDDMAVLGLLREICPLVADEVHSSVPGKFAQLVYAIRPLKGSALARINQAVKASELCSSPKLQDIWADALIMAATEGPAKLMTEQIKGKEVSTSRANYLLTMLAFANRPTPGAIKALLPLIQGNNVHRQAMLGLSAMIRNLIDEEEGRDHSQVPEVKQAVEALLAIVRKDKASPNAIVALKAIRNIGHFGSEVAQTIMDIASDKRTKTALRVVALAALKEVAQEEAVNRKALDIFADQDEKTEVRIQAYKVAVEKPTRASVQEIISILKRETSKQVGSYVSSHLENIQETSCPHAKGLRELLTAESIPSSKFPKDIRKYSRNFEVSHLFEQMNIGAVLDADIIYDSSFAPRSLKVNVTLPIAGKALNLFEFGVRQVGLEDQLESVFGPHGALSKKAIPELFAELVDFFQEGNPEINEIRSNRLRRASARPAYRGSAPGASDLEGSLWLKLDGKTIAYLDINDADSDMNDMGEVMAALQAKATEATSAVKGDRSFAFMFLDSTHDIPSVNGLPVKLDINGTVVVGYKAGDNGLYPSIAVELSSKIGFDARNSRPGVKLVQTLSSAPAVQARIESKDGRPIKVTFALPKDQIELFKYKSDVLVVDSMNQERPLKASAVRNVQGCTKSFDKVFGVEFCSKMLTPRPFFNPKTPVLPLNGPWALELTLKKTDPGMSGWEYTIELPADGASELQVYRASFNTPGSRVDRELSAELQVSAPRDGSSGARLRVKSPFKTIEASAAHKSDSTGLNTRAELTLDSKDKYAFEVGMDKSATGKKAEWKPKLRIQMPNQKPIQLGGSVVLDQGRKSQLAFDLHSNQAAASKQYFKGSFVKEGSVSSDFRLSSDVQGDLGVLVFRVFGMGERQAKSLSTDMKVEYQRPNQRKHNAKLVGKVQNLSTASLSKANSFLELQMTQYPQNNFHMSWNVQHKPSEHLENELTLMWDGQMRDATKRVHVLQVSTATGLTSGRTSTSENLLAVEIAPLGVNYQWKASGHFENSETPKFKIEVEGQDKSSSDKATKAAFEYQHISRKPLKLAMDASLRLPWREVIYSDKLEEVAPNEYKGNTNFQWNTDKKATLDYTYRVKTDSRKTHHELEAKLKTPSMRYGTHHNAMLRMTPDDIEIKSKLNHEQSNLWDFQSVLSSQGKSNLYLDTASLTSKFETNPYERTRTAAFELTGKTFPLSHQSNVQIAPDTMTVASKTIYKSKPVLTINAQSSTRAPSHLKIDTQLFDVRMDTSKAQATRTASVEIRTKSTPGSHKTTFSADANKFEIKSKTQYKSRPVASVEALLSKRGKSTLNIELPSMNAVSEAVMYGPSKSGKIAIVAKSGFEHKSEFSNDANLFKANSQTKSSGAQIAAFDGQLGDRSFFHMTTPRFSSNAEFDSAAKAAKFQATDFKNSWEHSTEAAMRGADQLIVSSKTESNGDKVALIDGLYSPSKSSVKVTCQPGEATFDLVPGKECKVEIKAKNSPIYHKTIVSTEPKAFTVFSKTVSADRQTSTLDSRLSRSERSSVRFEMPSATGKVEYNPSRTARSVAIDFNGKTFDLKHNSAATYEPTKRFEFVSTTQARGQKVLDIESKFAKGQNSHVKVVTQDWDTKFEAAPQGSRQKFFKIVANSAPNSVEHATEMNYEPRTSLKITSKTNHRGQDIFSLDSQMNAQAKSYLNMKSQPMNAAFEYQSANRGARHAANWKVDLKQQAINHDASVILDQDTLTVQSKTIKRSRPLMNLDAKFAPQSRSHVKISGPDFDGQIEGNLASATRSFKVDASCKRSGLGHQSAVSWEPRQRFNVQSKSTRRGSDLWALDANLLDDGMSHVKFASEPIEAAVQFTPRQAAQWSLKAKTIELNHNAKVNWDTNKIDIESKTLMQDRPLAQIKSRVSRSDKSTFELSTPSGSGSFEVSPFSAARSAKWNIAGGDRWVHDSALEYVPRRHLAFDSDNVQGGKSFLKINSRLVRGAKSNLKIDCAAHGKAMLEVEPSAARWELSNSDMSHKTNVAYEPNRHVQMSSTTKSRGRNIATVNAKLVKGGQQDIFVAMESGEMTIVAEPFAATRTGKVTIKRTSGSPFYHESAAALDARNQLTFNSKSQRGSQTIAVIDGSLGRSKRSHVSVQTPSHTGRFELSPFEQQKSAKLEIAGTRSGYKHVSTATLDRSALVVNSKTEKRGTPICQLDMTAARNARSTFNFLSDAADASGHLESGFRSANIEVRGKSLPVQHATNYALGAQDASLKTSTRWNSNEQFGLDGSFSTNAAKVALSNQLFNADLDIDGAQGYSASYKANARSAPRLMASASQDKASKGFRAELKWDADRDQEKKMTLVASSIPASRSDRKIRSQVTVTIGSQTEVALTSAMDTNVISGPHDIEIKYRCPRSTPKSVTYHHEVANGQAKCTAKYFENGTQKVAVSNTGRFSASGAKLELQAALDVQSEYKYQGIDGFHASMSHRHQARRDGFESSSEMKGQLGNGKPVQAKATTFFQKSRSSGKATVHLSAQTPVYDYQSQESNFEGSWDSGKVAFKGDAKSRQGAASAAATAAFATDKMSFSAEAKSNQGSASATGSANFDSDKLAIEGSSRINGKATKVTAQAAKKVDKVQASVEITSDHRDIPQASAMFSADSRSFAITADVNKDRKVSANGNWNYANQDSFEGSFEGKSAWSPRYATIVKGQRSSDSANYEVSAKKDSRELFSYKAGGRQTPNGYTGQAIATEGGQEMFRSNIERETTGSGEETFQVTARGRDFSPCKATFKLYQNAKEVRPSASLCVTPTGGSADCYTLSGSYKNNDSKWNKKIDRSLTINARDIDNNVASAEWIVSNNDKFLNKFQIQINDQKAGYDFEALDNGDKKNLRAAIHLPQRTMAANAIAEKVSKDEWRLVGEVQADAIREPQDKLTVGLSYKNKSGRNGRSILSEARAEHPAWSRPLTATFSVDTSSKTQAKLVLDIVRDPSKKIVVTAIADDQGKNSTIVLTANRADNAINAQLKSHLYLDNEKLTNGIQWQWTDRRRTVKEGMYFLKVDRKNINFVTNSPIGSVSANGDYDVNESTNTMSARLDTTVNGDQKKVDFQVEANSAPCVQWQLKSSQATPIFKWRGCVSAENGRTLKVTSETYEQGKKNDESSMVFDTSSGRVLRAHLKWDPQALADFLIKATELSKNKGALFARDMGFEEVRREFDHKSNLMNADFDNDVLKPFSRSMSEELNELERELRPVLKHMPKVNAALTKVTEAVSDAIDAMTPDTAAYGKSLDRKIRQITKDIKRNHDRESPMYKIAAAYDKSGPVEALIEAARRVRCFTKRAGRMSTSFAGDAAQSFAQMVPREWIKSVSSAAAKGSEAMFNNEIAAKIGQLMADSADATTETLGQSLKAIVEELSRAAGAALSNQDIKSLVSLLKEIVEEVRRELKNVDTKNISKLSADLVKFLASPENWSSHSRVLIWNPEDGEILVEMRAPFDVRRLKSTWTNQQQGLGNQSRKYSELSDKVNYLRSQIMARDWSAPFRAQAQLVGGQHFVTFDRKFYDFAGSDCTYVLAKDARNGNFSVSAKYAGVDQAGNVRKTIIVQIRDDIVEITPSTLSIRFDGKEVELPLVLSGASVVRQGDSILVDDKKGLSVECQLSRDICTVSLSGWYFGKTQGLLGTYDYEPENDFKTSAGLARDASELAQSWLTQSSCRSQNIARDVEVSKSSEAYEACYRHFVSESSPLREGFAIVEPSEYFRMCLRHSAASKAPADKAVCTVSAAYVAAVRHEGSGLNMPQGCLSCGATPFGSRTRHNSGYGIGAKKADVVFVVEEHECNRDLVKELASMARSVEADLGAEKMSAKFGLIGFGGPAEDGAPHAHTSRTRLLFDRKDLVLATEKMQFRTRANQQRAVDAFAALAYAAESQFRQGASKNLVLLSCTPCQQEASRLDYSDLQNMLLSEGITLHIVNDKAIELKTDSPSKQRGLFALDALTVFRGKDFTQKSLVGQPDMRAQVVTPKDVCVSLAQVSRGSFFTTSPSNSDENASAGRVSKTWKSLMSRRIVASAQPVRCQNCDCILDRDGMSTKTVCRPCKPSKPAVFANMY